MPLLPFSLSFLGLLFDLCLDFREPENVLTGHGDGKECSPPQSQDGRAALLSTGKRSDKADQQSNQHCNRDGAARIDSKRLQCHHRQQEDDRQACQQNIERNFIWGLL